MLTASRGLAEGDINKNAFVRGVVKSDISKFVLLESDGRLPPVGASNPLNVLAFLLVDCGQKEHLFSEIFACNHSPFNSVISVCQLFFFFFFSEQPWSV